MGGSNLESLYTDILSFPPTLGFGSHGISVSIPGFKVFGPFRSPSTKMAYATHLPSLSLSLFLLCVFVSVIFPFPRVSCLSNCSDFLHSSFFLGGSLLSGLLVATYSPHKPTVQFV